MTKDDLRSEIDRKRAEAARISGLRVHDAVQGLMDAVEFAQKKADAKTQITAWREISKLLGFYPDTTKSSRKLTIDPDNIQTWPDELLRKFATND